jgi:hypothetical protein
MFLIMKRFSAFMTLHRELLSDQTQPFYLRSTLLPRHHRVTMATTRRVILGYQSFRLVLILPIKFVIATRVTDCTCTQCIELLSKLLNLRFPLRICLAQTSDFCSCVLGLLPLSPSALCCCHFVLLAKALFSLSWITATDICKAHLPSPCPALYVVMKAVLARSEVP